MKKILSIVLTTLPLFISMTVAAKADALNYPNNYDHYYAFVCSPETLDQVDFVVSQKNNIATLKLKTFDMTLDYEFNLDGGDINIVMTRSVGKRFFILKQGTKGYYREIDQLLVDWIGVCDESEGSLFAETMLKKIQASE